MNLKTEINAVEKRSAAIIDAAEKRSAATRYTTIEAYGRLLGWRMFTIRRAQYDALKRNAPLSAAYRDHDGNWVVFSKCNTKTRFRLMDMLNNMMSELRDKIMALDVPPHPDDTV